MGAIRGTALVTGASPRTRMDYDIFNEFISEKTGLKGLKL